MTHPPDWPDEKWRDKLHAYVDGALTAGERAEVEGFLRRSPAARAELEALRGLSDSLHELEPPDPGPAYWARFSERVEARLPASANAARGARFYEALTAWFFPAGGFSWVRATGAFASLTLVAYIGVHGFRPALDQAERPARQGPVGAAQEKSGEPDRSRDAKPPAPESQVTTRDKAEAESELGHGEQVEQPSQRENREAKPLGTQSPNDPPPARQDERREFATALEARHAAIDDARSTSPAVLRFVNAALEGDEAAAFRARQAASEAGVEDDAQHAMQGWLAARAVPKLPEPEAGVSERFAIDSTGSRSIGRQLSRLGKADRTARPLPPVPASEPETLIIAGRPSPSPQATLADRPTATLGADRGPHPVVPGVIDATVSDASGLAYLDALVWPNRDDPDARATVETLALRLADAAEEDASARERAERYLEWLVTHSPEAPQQAAWRARLEALSR